MGTIEGAINKDTVFKYFCVDMGVGKLETIELFLVILGDAIIYSIFHIEPYCDNSVIHAQSSLSAACSFSRNLPI